LARDRDQNEEPDNHGAGAAALNIQGRAELLPPKPDETLPGYDTLEFKLVRSYVNGQAVDRIVCEGVVVDPPKRRAGTFDSRRSCDNNWNVMLFGRM
jgi:hypothetical protein